MSLKIPQILFTEIFCSVISNHLTSDDTSHTRIVYTWVLLAVVRSLAAMRTAEEFLWTTLVLLLFVIGDYQNKNHDLKKYSLLLTLEYEGAILLLGLLSGLLCCGVQLFFGLEGLFSVFLATKVFS